jgi:hypothetical protein
MEISIELRPHIGHKNTPLGPVAVEHDQWIVVLCRGNVKRQIGYQRKASKSPLLWLAGRATAIKEYGLSIVERAEELSGQERNENLGEDQPNGDQS